MRLDAAGGQMGGWERWPAYAGVGNGGHRLTSALMYITKNITMNFRKCTQLLLVACAFCLGFSGCSEDAEGGGGTYNGENEKVVGTKWTATNFNYGIGDDWASTLGETYNLYFYSATEGLLYYGRKDNDSDFGSSSERLIAHFTYNVRGGEIALDYITEPLFSGFNSLALSENTITVNGFEFTRGSADANDNEWLATLHGTTGECRWYHNLKNALWIVGEGNMGDYSSFSQTPWSKANRLVNYVYIEDGVTSVGDNAFANVNVAEVDIPSTVTRLGRRAFSGSIISSVSLPDAITEIPEEAFSGCNYLTNVRLPKNVETIGDMAFNGCKKASLSSTKKLRHIGNYAFQFCNVTTWTDSEVLESIGMYAFTDCGFSELDLPNSLREIGALAFTDDGISKIHVGTGLTTVENTPFYCSSRNGSMYVNKNTPIELTHDIIENAGKWTLYVPVGSKAVYSKAAYWKNFKNIYESDELTGDGTTPDGDDDQSQESGTSEEEQDEIDAQDSRRGPVSTGFSGSGTSSSPYLIRSAADLRLLSDECRNGNTFKGKHFKMTADITINRNVLDADGNPNDDSGFERWIPIGRTSYKQKGFHGTFDGNGHTISGIYINRISSGAVGLFGNVLGDIKGVTLKDSYICGSQASWLGGIVAHVVTNDGSVEISDCHNFATVVGGSVGGVVGIIGGSYIARVTQCSNHGAVIGSVSMSGGVVGSASAEHTYVTDCVNAGDVKAFNCAGIMTNLTHATIKNCINTGNVTAEQYAAGLGGRVMLSSTITNCVNLGKIDGPERSSALAYYSRSCTINWNYYLSTMSTSAIALKEGNSTTNNNEACSSMEMKSEDVLSALNRRNGSGNSRWVEGDDGYPMLEWFANNNW